jgi:ATP-dependent Clp protease ATP-binding subunit ClpC
MDHHVVEKFTTHLKNVLTRALCFVVETQQKTIEPEHLLWALGTEKGSIGAEVLHKANVKVEALRQLIGAAVKTHIEPVPSSVAASPLLSENAKRTIEKAVLAASVYEHQYVGTEHLLSGLLQVRDKTIEEFFDRSRVDLKEVRQHLAIVLKSTSKFPEMTQTVPETAPVATATVQAERTETDIATRVAETEQKEKTPALDFFGRDLSSPEMQARIDPVIGREEEIQRVMEILCRRTKNNPLLLGEPGVGKTAIVEGFAKLLHEGAVPAALQGKRVIALDLSSMIAGTMYRGEFEARLRQVVEEARENEDVILFIDEVHMLIGAGAATGSLDAANMLKPALARGDIRCIGATTLSEFKKHMETDAALERRFQSVMVDEPSPEDTLSILRGIARYFERFHRVQISDSALKAAVTLSMRYQPEKHLPDKAIDLIDEAAAAARVRSATPNPLDRTRLVERELEKLREEKRQAVAEENFTNALALKEKERALLAKWESIENEPVTPSAITIDESDVRAVLARTLKIPLAHLAVDERERLLDLESRLSAHVIGQPEAIRLVSDAVRRAKTGVTNPARPLASFLFLGPSGVGKTELAKAIALEVFRDTNALVRLDMSEFAEGYTVSKLLGSPAGYVGYRESAKLTDQVKQRPYCVVLFDEMEKAHPDVQNLLLQLLENGEVTDATGRRVNFRNAIVVMTSNVGLEKLEGGHVGFANGTEDRKALLEQDLRRELEERFRPELVNRIDAVCVFDALDESALTQIADKQLRELVNRVKDQDFRLTVDPTISTRIAARARDSKLRAREIRKIIQTEVEPLIAFHLLKKRGRKLLRVTHVGDAFAVFPRP